MYRIYSYIYIFHYSIPFYTKFSFSARKSSKNLQHLLFISRGAVGNAHLQYTCIEPPEMSKLSDAPKIS